MFLGIPSISVLLKQAEDSYFHEKLNSMIITLQDIYRFHRKIKVGLSDKTLDASTYNKIMTNLSNVQKGERPMEEKIKELSDNLDLNSDLRERLSMLLTKGTGDEDTLSRDLAAYLIHHRESPDSGDVRDFSKDTTSIKDRMPNPVTEGGGRVLNNPGMIGAPGMRGMASEKEIWNKIAVDGSTPILEKVIGFFKENPAPDDNDVHAFAEKENIDPHELEEEVYRILGAFIGEGKSNLPDNKNKDFSEDQTEKGIKVEKEHFEGTDLPEEIVEILAEKINNDHLSEEGMEEEYYNALLKMEEDLKKKNNVSPEEDKKKDYVDPKLKKEKEMEPEEAEK
ncbi:MAG TPA: hypothetical protein P5136_02755 [Methanofastidiosum sp.]|nr:hypothetical protein [Methanofastidiosum sp.]